MQYSNTTERRSAPRLDLQCPVKIYDSRSRKYRSGITRNVSSSGALIEVHGGIHTLPGEPVGMAIDWQNETPLTWHADLLPVTVIRVNDKNNEKITLAIKFNSPQSTPYTLQPQTPQAKAA